MPDSLADREREEGERFVGLASDVRKLAVFEIDDGRLSKIKEPLLDPERPAEFLAWLDSVVALKSSLPPDLLTLHNELGRDSLAFRKAEGELVELWSLQKGERAVYLKRQLWAQLLKLVYGREADSDSCGSSIRSS